MRAHHYNGAIKTAVMINFKYLTNMKQIVQPLVNNY